MWTVKVFTLYPELFPGPLASGLYKKALEKKIWSLKTVDIRDSANDKHKTVDDAPFGGGSGMIIRPDVLANSLDKNITDKKEPVIYLTPKGKKFDQKYSKKISKKILILYVDTLKVLMKELFKQEILRRLVLEILFYLEEKWRLL